MLLKHVNTVFVSFIVFISAEAVGPFASSAMAQPNDPARDIKEAGKADDKTDRGNEGQADPLAQALTYHHDFRGRPVPEELVPVNAEGDRFFKEEPQGFRITLPNTWKHPFGGVGLRTGFGFGGDFEATAAVEIIHNETPPGGYGVGVNMVANAGGKQRACLSRMVKADGRQMIYVEHTFPKWGDEVVPCDEKLVRLRLKRSGPIITFSWAPGIVGGEFQDVHQCDFGNEDIKHLVLSGITGRQPCNVDVRLIDLRIRSQKSEAPAAVLEQNGKVPDAVAHSPASAATWLIWIVPAVLLLLVPAMCFAVWLARRRPATESVEADVDESEDVVSFLCSQCGRSLAVAADLVGKKVRCRQCGAAVKVARSRSDA